MIGQTEDGKLWESLMHETLDENNGEILLTKLISVTDKKFIQRKKNVK